MKTMKSMKKLLALAMVLVMMTGLALSVLAADPTGSITISPAVTDPNTAKTTYEAYKVFDMKTTGQTDANGNYTGVSYTINSAWSDFFASGAPGAAYIVDTDSGDLNPIVIGGVIKYINITSSNVVDFAKAAFAFAQAKPIAPATTQQVDKGATEVVFSNLPLGYYMVYPKGASIDIESYTSVVSLTSTSPNATIAQKAKYPTLNKTADDISVEVGQTVTYTLTSEVPNVTGYNVYEMTFSDTTTAGLTFDGKDSITVKIGSATLTTSDYSVSTTNPDFALTINMLKEEGGVKVAKYTAGDAITITYTATVNKNAVTVISKNHATLTYNNDPKNGSNKSTTPPIEIPVYSSKLKILKVDGNNTATKLQGAKFVLRCKTPGSATGDTQHPTAGQFYKFTAGSGTTPDDVSWVTVSANPTIADLIAKATAGDITAVVTDANGEAAFDGLEDGVYELIEIEAPEGYNLVKDPVEVTIAGSSTDAATLTVTSTVQDFAGALLPSTGGIGTTLFYVIGAILALGAGVVLVTKRRVRE